MQLPRLWLPWLSGVFIDIGTNFEGVNLTVKILEMNYLFQLTWASFWAISLLLFSFFYHSVKFFQTVFDYFFSIAHLLVNLIPFRDYDIEQLEYSLSIFFQNIIKQFFLILCTFFVQISHVRTTILIIGCHCNQLYLESKSPKRLLLGTDYKTFWPQNCFYWVLPGDKKVLILVCCGNIFFFLWPFPRLVTFNNIKTKF